MTKLFITVVLSTHRCTKNVRRKRKEDAKHSTKTREGNYKNTWKKQKTRVRVCEASIV